MTLDELLKTYDPTAPLAEAFTLPAPFYTDPRIAALERARVFSRTWQVVGRADQVRDRGQYLTATVADEPVVVVRGGDGALRAFYNVCRHHAAAVMTEPAGQVQVLRCPYHGWTYSLEGQLRGTPDFGGVCRFDKGDNGLVPIAVAEWDPFVLVRLAPSALSIEGGLGADLIAQVAPLGIGGLRFAERRRYRLACNWKVYIDNYLDGGYHVPHLHPGLGSVLDNGRYATLCGERSCMQASPLAAGGEAETAAVRGGDQARYFWVYPNFMINCYAGMMDTNLVIPLGVAETEVVFDFYFSDVSEAARAHNEASIAVSQRIQDEDVAICESVQRGLGSRAYGAGRLSVRREAGEHLFHRLLHADL